MPSQSIQRVPQRSKLSSSVRQCLGLKAASNKETITALANKHGVSRTTVRTVKNKVLQAIDDAFHPPKSSDAIFHLPVTKQWLNSLVLGLMLTCRASYRNIISIFRVFFDTKISLGKIHDIYLAAAKQASTLNRSVDLSDTSVLCSDELYHLNKPVLNAIDSASLYCCILSGEAQRDEETWSIHLMDAKDQGLLPRVCVNDQASGLMAAHEALFPCADHRYDNFHLSRSLMDLRKFFRNRYRSSITAREAIEEKIKKGITNYDAPLLMVALNYEKHLRYISTTINTLISWLEHDVLNKPGAPYKERDMLYDFILCEFRKLERIEPNRVSSICTLLFNKKESSLQFVNELEKRFAWTAQQNHIPIDWVWEMSLLQRCEFYSDQYTVRMVALKKKLGDKFDDVEFEVSVGLDATERTSSMIENCNGRVRKYLYGKGRVSNTYLGLVKFHLNHSPLVSSTREERKNKTPREILTDKSHPHWLEMLGYDLFKKAA